MKATALGTRGQKKTHRLASLLVAAAVLALSSKAWADHDFFTFGGETQYTSSAYVLCGDLSYGYMSLSSHIATCVTRSSLRQSFYVDERRYR